MQGEPWTLTGDLPGRLERDAAGAELLPVDAIVLRRLQEEEDRRATNRELIRQLQSKNPSLANDSVLIH